ncbi:MAG: type IV secretion system DNA-binding domain-containing protein, partial [bacterium]|nr:type IV secretion system DNA-binding domain-containing protein [bacterium]
MNYLIYIAALLALPFLGYLVYWLYKKNKHAMLMGELSMQLFSIRIPQLQKKEGEAANFKAEINLSEQLLTSLSSLKFPFAFEVAVHHIGEDIHFYMAVHKNISDAVIKQVQGIWPDAQVQRAHEFNIFNSGGVNLGAYLTQKENYALPVKTYQEIEGDTFGPIVSALAKLDDIGEGGALQIIILPAPKNFKKNIVKYLERLKKGESVKDVLKTSIVPNLSDFKGAFSMKDDKDKKEEPKVVDESAVKALEMKVSKPLFRVNVRAIVSAGNPMQAEHLLSGLTTGFSQFFAPVRNQFKITIPKNPEKLLYQYSFREFNENQAMVLNSEEIASFFHLPISSTNIPRIKWLKSKEAPPPVDLPAEGLLIGESDYRGETKPVLLLDEDRRRHLYLVGQTGTGKSTLIYNMAMEDIRKGKGVGVLDPNGDLIQDILASIPQERVDDLILFDPTDIDRPLGMNILEYDHSKPEYKTFIVNEVQGIFNRLFPPESMGPMFEQYMRNALLLLMEDSENEPSTLTEVPRIFTDTDYRERRLDRIVNPAVQDFWRNEAIKAGGEASLANMTPYITS